MSENVIPPDTRYVPIPQQPYCCGPACLSMIMLRHGLKLYPQELIGYHLGLVVPTELKEAYYNPRHATVPVVASGFGTQIQNEKYGMQKMLDTLGIPLRFTYIGADTFGVAGDFARCIREIISDNGDVLVCLNTGALRDKPERNWGHILCIDQIYEKDMRLIETDVEPMWRSFPIEKVYDAVTVHGRKNYGGLWVFDRG